MTKEKILEKVEWGAFPNKTATFKAMDEFAQQEAIAFAEFIGQQKVFNTLHADNKRYWDKMIGNGKYTTEQLFQEYLKQKK